MTIEDMHRFILGGPDRREPSQGIVAPSERAGYWEGWFEQAFREMEALERERPTVRTFPWTPEGPDRLEMTAATRARARELFRPVKAPSEREGYMAQWSGIPLWVSECIPEGEWWFIQDGQVVGKIVPEEAE